MASLQVNYMQFNADNSTYRYHSKVRTSHFSLYGKRGMMETFIKEGKTGVIICVLASNLVIFF